MLCPTHPSHLVYTYPPTHAAIQHLVLLDRVPRSMDKTLLLRTTPKPFGKKGDRASKGTTDQTPSSADESVGTDVSQVINMNTTAPSCRPEAPRMHTPHIAAVSCDSGDSPVHAHNMADDHWVVQRGPWPAKM